MVTGKTVIVLSLAVALLIVGVSFTVFKGPLVEEPVALTFEECVERGYEVTEAEPRRCATPEGISFVEGGEPSLEEPEEIEEDPGSGVTPAPPAAACVVGGCSSQLCVEEGDPGMSTCEYRAEYACYQGALCERQASGQCGWRQDSALLACLSNPPPLLEELPQ